MSWLNLVSLGGMLVFMALAWSVSTQRRMLNLRVIGFALLLQVIFGLIIFDTSWGRSAFIGVNKAITAVINAAQAGPRFVAGGLADPAATGQAGLGVVLIASGLLAIIVFAALIEILYHYGIMQLIVRGFSAVFRRLLRLSGAESVCAASNIFVGVESGLAVRPYLQRMTRSELMLVLSAQMATVASNVMVAYVSFLEGPFPQIAGHLVSASFLSIPAAVIMAKLMIPETEEAETAGQQVEVAYEREDTLGTAVIRAANQGMQLVLSIAALLVAVVGLVAIANLLLQSVAGGLNLAFGWDLQWSLEYLLSFLFMPFALLMGVAWQDVPEVAQLLGMRVILTEFASYGQLATYMAEGQIQPRSALIAAYSLCGFAHIPSIAIFVGGLSALVPERRKDIASLGLRALVAATLACLMTGAIAGLLYSGEPSVLLGDR